MCRCKRYFQRVRSEFVLFVANRVVNHVPSHCFRKLFYRTIMGFKIGSDSYIFMDAWFDARGGFAIGNNSVINQKCRLDTRGGIIIGNNVSIAAEVQILTADHDIQSRIFEGHTGSVSIGDFVFIGTRAILLKGVSLGKGAVICAGAVVTKDVEDFSVVAGVPAREIYKRTTTLDYTINYGRLFH
jgi:acetyltransferase-like isoleucine patch superfamily enzyme